MHRVRNVFILSSLLLVVFGASAALAGNPHFVKSGTGASLSGSNLVVSFKEAGLPSGSSENITVEATATTTYECVNNGGNHPKASNKSTSVTDVSKSDTFNADKNGNVTGSETLSPPSASDLSFSCPDDMAVTFVSVSYSNVSITDSTSGASTTLPGTFTYTNPSAP